MLKIHQNKLRGKFLEIESHVVDQLLTFEKVEIAETTCSNDILAFLSITILQ